jgi:hypothetical protein
MAPFWRGNQFVQTKKGELKWRAHDLKTQDAKLGSNSRIQFASNESKLVPRNLGTRPPNLKWALIYYMSIARYNGKLRLNLQGTCFGGKIN